MKPPWQWRSHELWLYSALGWRTVMLCWLAWHAGSWTVDAWQAVRDYTSNPRWAYEHLDKYACPPRCKPPPAQTE